MKSFISQLHEVYFFASNLKEKSIHWQSAPRACAPRPKQKLEKYTQKSAQNGIFELFSELIFTELHSFSIDEVMEDQIYAVLPKKLTIVFSFRFHISGFVPTEVLCCRRRHHHHGRPNVAENRLKIHPSSEQPINEDVMEDQIYALPENCILSYDHRK